MQSTRSSWWVLGRWPLVLLGLVIGLGPGGSNVVAQVRRNPGTPASNRPVDERNRQLQIERARRTFVLESRPKIASARKNWREGHHDEAVKELEQCLELARKTLGEQPNLPSVDIMKTLARIHESKRTFGAAAVELRRAVDMQIRLTGRQSWEAIELQTEIGRLERLGKLAGERLEVLSRLGPTTALVATGQGAVASAICIDPRGLFLTRARPLANLWRPSFDPLRIPPEDSRAHRAADRSQRGRAAGAVHLPQPGSAGSGHPARAGGTHRDYGGPGAAGRAHEPAARRDGVRAWPRARGRRRSDRSQSLDRARPILLRSAGTGTDSPAHAPQPSR